MVEKITKYIVAGGMVRLYLRRYKFFAYTRAKYKICKVMSSKSIGQEAGYANLTIRDCILLNLIEFYCPVCN